MQTIKSKQTLISQNNYPKLKTLVNFTWVGGLMAGILYISGLIIDMLITKQIFEILIELNSTYQTTILLVEQNANLALRYADAAYIIENGRVGLAGPAAELRGRPDIQAYYLGQALAA